MRIKVVLEVAGALCLALAASCGDMRPRAPVSDGERLYTARCTGCHAAYEPHERAPAEWEAAVAKMERWKKVSLSPGERSLILDYLAGSPAAAQDAATAATSDAVNTGAPRAVAAQALLRK